MPRKSSPWRPEGLSIADLRLFGACRVVDRIVHLRDARPGVRYRETVPAAVWAKMSFTSNRDMVWGLYLVDPRRTLRLGARGVERVLEAYLAKNPGATEGVEELREAIALLRRPDDWESQIPGMLATPFWAEAHLRSEALAREATDYMVNEDRRASTGHKRDIVYVAGCLSAARYAVEAEGMWAGNTACASVRLHQWAGAVRASKMPLGDLCSAVDVLRAWEAV